VKLEDIDKLDAKALAALPPDILRYLIWQAKWLSTARPNQIPPAGDWTELGVMAGRGFGKTRVGAEWLASAAIEDPDALDRAVIAPTYQDVKFTCFQGPAGLLKLIPPELVEDYNSTDLVIKVKTLGGKIGTIRGFTAEKPERLRGPQHADIWADELAAWQYPAETWDMALMGLRLGARPRVVWTTTPKPIDLVRRLVEPKRGRVIVRGSTYENRANLPDSFFDQLAQYEGTAIGRQELEGELIDLEESGVIKRSWFRLWPAKQPLPAFDWIVMSLDTAYTEATTDRKTHDPDYTACTVWGGFRHRVKTASGAEEERAFVLLLDCWQDRLGLPDLIARVKRELNVAYGDDRDTALVKPLIGPKKPIGSGRKVDMVIVEEKGSGISLRQMLDREGIMAHAYNPGRADKLTRLHIVSPFFARRLVWLPESDKFPGKPRTWVDPLLSQLCAFTGSGSIKHDDFVDSTTQALRLMADKGMLSAVAVKPVPVREHAPPRNVTNPYAA
jgi:predicted phage terminase large subunit-like protein